MKKNIIVLFLALCFLNLPAQGWDITTNPPHMFNLNAGNIGIGISNPMNKLDIAGNLKLHNYRGSALILNSIGKNKGHEYILVSTATNNTATEFGSFGIKDQSSNINVGNGGAYELERWRFIINPEGNIGIGTTKPESKLHISGGDIYIEDTNKGIIMKSTNGNCWRLNVNNSGNPNFIQVACPH